MTIELGLLINGVITVATGAAFFGSLKNKVENNDDRIDDVEAALSVRIEKLEEQQLMLHEKFVSVDTYKETMNRIDQELREIRQDIKQILKNVSSKDKTFTT
jgi:peptidoglycan hydrolase CwlO-like protein